MSIPNSSRNAAPVDVSSSPLAGDGGVVREDVRFHSGGQRCEGWLYRPPGFGPYPCVVLSHGIGGIRSAAPPDFAKRFAAGGIAALTFDYRHLGTSAGQPRGLIDIRRQRADFRVAIELAGHLDGIDPDRIAVWGTSFGGGHVLAAVARNPRIAAAMQSAGRAQALRLAWRAVRDEIGGRLGRDPLRIDLAGPPCSLAMMTTPDALAGFESILPLDPVGWEPLQLKLAVVGQCRGNGCPAR